MPLTIQETIANITTTVELLNSTKALVPEVLVTGQAGVIGVTTTAIDLDLVLYVGPLGTTPVNQSANFYDIDGIYYTSYSFGTDGHTLIKIEDLNGNMPTIHKTVSVLPSIGSQVWVHEPKGSVLTTTQETQLTEASAPTTITGAPTVEEIVTGVFAKVVQP